MWPRLLPRVAEPGAVVRLVRRRANGRVRRGGADSENATPAGPASDTSWTSDVPSEKVHVIVTGAAPGVRYPGEHDGLLYSRRFVPKIREAAASAAGKLLVL